MIPIRSGFHKKNYKMVWFSLFFSPKNLYARQGYQYFKKIKLVLNMLILEILRTIGSPLLVLTNRELLINWL